MPQRVRRSNSDTSLYDSDESYKPSDMSVSSDNELKLHEKKKMIAPQHKVAEQPVNPAPFPTYYVVESSATTEVDDDDFIQPPRRLVKVVTAQSQNRFL